MINKKYNAQLRNLKLRKQKLGTRRPAPTANSTSPSKSGLHSGGISYGDTLPTCENVAAAAGWLERTHEGFCRKALKAVERRKISDTSRSVLNALLTDRGAASETILTNPRIRSDAFPAVTKALNDVAIANPDWEFKLVTLISGNGAFSSFKPVINLYAAQKNAKATLKAMAPNYFAITEFTLFNNVQHPDGGQHIQEHTHAIIFGPDLSKAEKLALRHRAKFPPNVTDARWIDIKSVKASETNLARVVAYLLKAPSKAKNFRPPSEGKRPFLNTSEKSDRFMRFLRMAQLRSTLTFEDVAFAGGTDGRQVLRTVRDILRAVARSDAPASSRVISAEAIPALWVELAKELEKNEWALPVIKRRP